MDEPEVVPGPSMDRIERQDRPEFRSEPPREVVWTRSFRLQVAARGPRLAACFEGMERPGRLKWSTAVEPVEGRVSDHQLEPMLLTQGVTSQEEACVLDVLSDPPYRIDADEGSSGPTRVSLVIEF